MPSTATWLLPYPARTDLADPPLDLKKLADRLEVVFTQQAGIPLGGCCDWPWAGGQIPSWGLLPYGQLLTQTAYPNLQTLADASGRPYGGTAGVNFNLPDYRGRVGAGKDDMGGTAANRITAAVSGTAGTVLGAAVGSEGVALANGQLPAHTHTFTTGTESVDHSHNNYFNTGYISSDHSHSFDLWVSGAGPGDMQVAGNSAGAPVGPFWKATGGVSANHVHLVSGNTGGRSAAHTHAGTTDASGSGSMHLNMQPTIVVNKLLRAI
jgi:microcystin-dependent protein